MKYACLNASVMQNFNSRKRLISYFMKIERVIKEKKKLFIIKDFNIIINKT